MAGESDIEWTDATWNPVSGCRILSAGCTNCYAMRMAARLQAMDHPSYRGVVRRSGGRPKWTGRIHLNDGVLSAPMKWRKPRRIFVNSMSDLFQDGVARDFIARVWSTMEQCPQHTFQILTKRPGNMRALLADRAFKVLPNVWLGTSVEDAEAARRIAHLRETPAAVRFISFEPLVADVGRINLHDIHWAIVGGESGPGARLMKEEWVDNIRAQCRTQDVAFFFKQWGGTNKKRAGRLYKGQTWDEYPDVRIQTPA